MFPNRHLHCPLFRTDHHRPVAHATHHIHRLLRFSPQRQLLEVRLHPFLHYLAQLLADREKPVRGTHPFDPLVWPLVVVEFHPPCDPLPCRLERVELRPTQELLPDRLPEAFDFPKRLGMMWLASEVMHAVLLQLLLEPRLPTPVRVLPPIVRQHLLRHPVFARPAPVDLQHVLRRLAPVEPQRDDIPRIVVYEPDQVRHLSAQMERKDIALPHLVRGTALEKARLRGIPGRPFLHHRHQLLRGKRPPHRLRAGRHEQHPLEKLRDPFDAETGIRLLDLDDLLLQPRQRPVALAPVLRLVPGTQPFFTTLTVTFHPCE